MTSFRNGAAAKAWKQRFKASVAVPAMALIITPATAQQLVTVNSPVSVGVLNTQVINAMVTPSADVTLDVRADGVVTGGGTVVLSPQAAGQGSGVLRLTNAGKLGAVDADGNITDTVGVFASAIGVAGQRFEATNSGLITGSVQARFFTEGASVTNSGTVRGSVFVDGLGPASLTSTGSIGAGGASVFSYGSTKVATVDGVTTTTTTGAAASASVANVGTKAARGNVDVFGSTATAEVTGVAGSVSATAYGTITQVDGKTSAPAASKTVTTFDRSVSRAGGAATVTIASTADLANLEVSGVASATADVAGKVSGLVNVTGGQFGTQTDVRTETRDADNQVTARTSSAVTAPLLDSAAKLSLAATASVGTVAMQGFGDASAAINGEVVGGISVTRFGNGFATTETTTFDGKTGNTLTTSFDQAERQSKGGAALTMASTGKAASVFMNSNGGSLTADISGKVAGSVTLFASETLSRNVATQTFDAKSFALAENTTSFSATLADGKVGLTVGKTGVVGAITADAGAAGAVVSIAGEAASTTVRSDVLVTASATTANRFDPPSGTLLSQVSKRNEGFVGGAIALDVSGKTGAVLLDSGAGNVSATVSGTTGTVQMFSQGTRDVTEQTFDQKFDSKGVLLEQVNNFTSKQTATGGTTDLTVAAGGRVESLFARSDAGASVVNNGTIVGSADARASGSVLGSRVFLAATAVTGNDKQSVTTTTNADSLQRVAVGGTVSLVNSATGQIGDPSTTVTLNGVKGVSINNDGGIRGNVSAFSREFVNSNAFSSKDVRTTVFAAGDVPETTTTAFTQTTTFGTVVAGGNVEGRFAGSVGTTNFTPAAVGNVSLTAQGNARADVVASGGIFGSLTLSAGQGNGSSFTGNFASTRVLDTKGRGSFVSTINNEQSFATADASLASATIAGRVGFGNGGGAGTVSLTGNNASLAVAGGIIDGSASVSATGRITTDNKFGRNLTQSSTDFVDTTTALAETNSTRTTRTGGTASLDFTSGTIGGTATISGLQAASATVAAPSRISGSLLVSTSGANNESTTVSNFARTSAGVVTASQTARSVDTNVAGSATGNVAGSVLGNVTVSAAAGDATLTLPGRVTGSVSVLATGANSDVETVNRFSGKLPASNALSYVALSVPTVASALPVGATAERVTTTITTATGGKASATIETAAALQATGTIAAGSVSVGGLGGSTATLGVNSLVSGSVAVGLVGENRRAVATRTAAGTTLGTQVSETSTDVRTAVGGAASLINNGKIDGIGSALSISNASVTNNGRAGGLSATAVASNTSTTIVDNRIDNPVVRVQTETVVRTAALGTASVTNAAGAVAGTVAVAGGTGTVTNAGFITGTTTLGQSLALGTTVVERTDGSSSFAYTAPDKRAAQSYTFDQNGIARGIRVEGATFTPTNLVTGVALAPVQTSDITATINLNNGSVTLGDITAQTNTAGRLTDTTLNLRGSGWLGADAFTQTGVAPTRTPMLTLTTAARTEYGTTPVTVRVLGINTMRKQDAGTFVINGSSFVPATVSTPANWTLDVGSFAIDGGEVQLAVPTGTFGIRGNVTNAATLVLGRRAPVATQLVGDSLVGIGPERIVGLTVNQTGNFTQTAAGTLVVGATGSLTRFTPANVPTAGAASELLGPVAGGVNIPYFTSPTLAATGSTASRIDVTGDLTLAGTVRVVVSRDSIYRDGDATTLATYTGAGNVTATASPTISSPFVSFRVVNDATARTVRLVASRASYASVAVGGNAQAAATALNSAIPAITSAILTDSTGGAAFGTVRSLANAQDVANVVNALDWRLSSAQAAQLFDELSSGEIYASIAAVDQNLVFNRMPSAATATLLAGGTLSSRLWASPVGDFSRFNGDATAGSTGIRSSAYGVAFGGDIAFAEDGVIGLGAAYGEHDVAARGTPETARIRTWTIGAHVLKGFGNIYVQGSIAYGFSRFEVDRSLSLLARNMGSNFRGTQLDATLEAGYRFDLGKAWTIAPFAQLGLRNWEMNEAVEADGAQGGGLAVRVDEASKSIFRPAIGARINGQLGSADGLQFRPLLNLSYTFQGDIGAARSMRFAGGGDAFTVRGFSPDGFGTVEAGLDTIVNQKLNLFLRGSYNFGGGNNAAAIRAGLGFSF